MDTILIEWIVATVYNKEVERIEFEQSIMNYKAVEQEK